MTPKQRILAALRSGRVDRVPAMPDLYLMFPARFNGLSQWDLVGPKATVPIHCARLAACRHFGFDAWIDASIAFEADALAETRIISENEHEYLSETTQPTPKGPLIRRTAHPRDEACWTVKYPVDELETDLPKLECLLEDDAPGSWSDVPLRRALEDTGGDGVVFSGGGCPGINWWLGVRGPERGIMDVFDHVDRLLPLWKRWEDRDLERVRITCEAGAEVVYGGGSYTSLSLISPDWYGRYVAPYLGRTAALCHQYGVPFVVQTNGRSSAVIETVANTGVDALLPMERAPLGDVDFAHARAQVGERLTFIGNVDPGRKCRLFFGARTCDDVMYLQDFLELSKSMPNLRVHYALSEPKHSPEWEGETGFIHERVAEHVSVEGRHQAFLCGPPLMIEASMKVLKDKQIPREQIFYDEF